MKEIEQTAYHEAAHAVVCVELHVPFKAVSIISEGDSAGRVTMGQIPKDILTELECSMASQKSEKWTHRRLQTLLAGPIIAEIMGRTVDDSSGSRGDLRAITYFAMSVSGNQAITETLIAWLWERTKAILWYEPNRIALHAVAQALLEKRYLSTRTARKIMREAIWPVFKGGRENWEATLNAIPGKWSDLDDGGQ